MSFIHIALCFVAGFFISLDMWLALRVLDTDRRSSIESGVYSKVQRRWSWIAVNCWRAGLIAFSAGTIYFLRMLVKAW